MASERKYKCIYCSKSFSRNSLSVHIEKDHIDMLDYDSNHTANRVVFDICNKKIPIGDGHGMCRICKKSTEWNEKNVRYEAFCSKVCKEKAREIAVKNMIKVYNKPTLLGDIEHQEKMLANRSISGKYKWSDGSYKTYVGSYEKKFLEFMDTVMEVRSEDLITPGPTIEYEFEGETHTWITDALYIPYNLVFDIKDGGDNKNKREMPIYRNKQIAKETMITSQGVYSYIRLTNNEFLQLLEIFAELKRTYLDEEDPKNIYRIHEMSGAVMGALPPAGMPQEYPQPNTTIYINRLKSNTFDRAKDNKYTITNDITSDYSIYVDDDGKIKKEKSEDINEGCSCNIYKYKGNNSAMILNDIYYKYKNNITVPLDYLAKIVTESDYILSNDQLDFSPLLEEVDLNKINEQFHANYETVQFQYSLIKNPNKVLFPVLDPVKYEYKKSILKEYKDLTIVQDMSGKYFAINTTNFRKSRGVDSIYDISDSILKSVS